jgi:hypothetical protein
MVPKPYVRTASEKSHEDAESQVEYHARDDVLAELESFARDAGDAIDWGVCDRFRGCYGCAEGQNFGTLRQNFGTLLKTASGKRENWQVIGD